MEHLKVNDVVRELYDRNVQFDARKNGIFLRKLLADEYHGIHHLPFLLYGSGETNLKSVGLEDYEILPFEPLHGVSGHLKNLYAEIPYHLKGEEKKLFEDAIKLSFGSREMKRASDYRQSLIDVILYLDGKICKKFIELLKQLAEIQEIAYADENKRTIKKVFRLHNLTFVHGMEMGSVLSSTYHVESFSPA